MANFNENNHQSLKLGIMHVIATKKPPIRMKIQIRPPWLADLGFVYGAPIYAVPQQDGLTIALHENAAANSGGKLLHVSMVREKPFIVVNLTQNFSATGLTTGDFLAAKYEYGVITAKKLPDAQKYFVIGSQKYNSFLQFSGEWLNDLGFLPQVVTTVAVADKNITFRIWDGMENYKDFVKFARSSKCQIIQPRKNQHITTLDIPSYILSDAGLCAGNISGVHCEFGKITMFKPDLQTLGL